MSTPKWVVTSVTPQENYTLLLTFADGKTGCFNALPLLQYSINAPLKDISFFMKAKLSYDTVVWNDQIDIAPEYLYDNCFPTKITKIL